MSRTNLLLTVLVMSFLVPAMAFAQGAPDNGGNQGGRQRGNFDPAQMRQRMNERMKTELKVTDDEWAILQPKIEKIQTIQRDTMMAGMGGRMMGGRRGGPAADANAEQPEQSEVAKAATELRTALQDENTAATTINEKLLAYRTAKAKAMTELEVARKDLKELLTPRQEAVLVMQGLLE